MKVIVSLLVVISLLVGASLWTQHYFTNTTQKMVEQLKQIESAIEGGKWEIANNGLAEFKNSWTRNKNIWQTLLDHQEIDNIDMSLSKVNKMVKMKNSTFALPEVATLKLLVMHIPINESFRLENVL